MKSQPLIPPPSRFSIQAGFDADQREIVADLYWQAFSGKLGKLMRPDAKALAFFRRVLNPEFALSACAPDGSLLGVAGFKTAQGALAGGGFIDLAQVYGWPGAAWRGLFLALLERDTQDGCLLMDGIFVAQTARGQGVGSALLRAIKSEAAQRGLAEVRLDVIDTNPRARALYERQGFVAGQTQHLGPLRHLFGFSSSLEMRYSVCAKDICRDAAN